MSSPALENSPQVAIRPPDTDSSAFGAVPAVADAETSKPVGVIVRAWAGFPINGEGVLDAERGSRE